MERAYRLRIYPNSSQRELFAKSFDSARWVWSVALKWRSYSYKTITARNMLALATDGRLESNARDSQINLTVAVIKNLESETNLAPIAILQLESGRPVKHELLLHTKEVVMNDNRLSIGVDSKR